MNNSNRTTYQEIQACLARTLYENFWRDEHIAVTSWLDIGELAQQCWYAQADAALSVVRQHLSKVDFGQAPSWLSQSEKTLWAQGFDAAAQRFEEIDVITTKSG